MVTLCHSDEVSGTTILDDGTKIFWSESGSTSVVVSPDGTKTVVDSDEHPYQEQLDAAMGNMAQMSPEEEAEFEKMMYQ